MISITFLHSYESVLGITPHYLLMRSNGVIDNITRGMQVYIKITALAKKTNTQALMDFDIHLYKY